MKTLGITLAGLTLALTSALAAPSTGGSSLHAPGGIGGAVEILSSGKVVGTVTLAQGVTDIRADHMTHKSASRSASVTMTGHVSVVVTQGGQVVSRLNADEARVTVQTPG